MSTLVNPVTKRTFELDHLLSCWIDWSSDPKLVAVLLRKGIKPMTLKILAHQVQTMLEGRKPIAEKQVCAWLLAFIGDRVSRRQVARYVSQSRQVPLRDAVRDLYVMAQDCRKVVDSQVLKLAPMAVIH